MAKPDTEGAGIGVTRSGVEGLANGSFSARPRSAVYLAWLLGREIGPHGH
jgi:hypothetical protein